MFVPYSRITPSVSLYTTSRSPFLPVCLTSRHPLTIFFSLLPLSFPYFSLLFLSSLLSRAHISLIFLSVLRHLSGIPHHQPDTFQIGNYKVRQEKEAGGRHRQSQRSEKNIGSDKSNTRKQAGRNKQRTGSTRKVPGRNTQYTKENGSSPKNCRKAAGSFPAPTTLQHRAFYTLPLPPLRGSRITGYHVNFKNRLR